MANIKQQIKRNKTNEKRRLQMLANHQLKLHKQVETLLLEIKLKH